MVLHYYFKYKIDVGTLISDLVYYYNFIKANYIIFYKYTISLSIFCKLYAYGEVKE